MKSSSNRGKDSNNASNESKVVSPPVPQTIPILAAISPTLFFSLPAPISWIPERLKTNGFQCFENFVSSEEQQTLVHFLNEQKNWSTETKHARKRMRRTLFFGTRPLVLPSLCSNIPPEFSFLLKRLIEQNIFSFEDPPTSVSIQEYVEDQGIGAHVDSLDYGPIVAVVSLGDACPLQFQELGWTHDPQYSPYDIQESNMPGHPRFKSFKSTIDNNTPYRLYEPLEVYIPSRSIYVLSQDTRYAFQHAVKKVKKNRACNFRRLSLAFRTVAKRFQYTPKKE